MARKYLQLSQNSKSRGLEFSLTLDDIRALLTAERCYYTGWKFSKSSPATCLSFDRRDNKQGYVPGNVVACMSMINSLKNQLVENKDAPFKDNPELLAEVVAKWVAPAPPVKVSLWRRVLKALLPEAALPQQQTENAL